MTAAAVADLPTGPSQGGPLLELRALEAGYGSTTVLHGVSLSVHRGQVVALLGPNGAGKSTLLRAASGLLRPRSGSILFDGADVTRMRADKLANLGICHVPEARGVFPGLTVRENLALASPRGTRAASIEQAVARFPILGKKLDQPAGAMSGGQQQMLAVVRAYIADPACVLVDEVSMGLAPVIVDEIYEFLSSVANTGTSFLLVEQYVKRALAVADEVVLLAKGKVVASGAPGEFGDDIFERYMGGAAGGTLPEVSE